MTAPSSTIIRTTPMPATAPAAAVSDVLTSPNGGAAFLAVAATDDTMRQARSISRDQGAEAAWAFLEAGRGQHEPAVTTSGTTLNALTGLLTCCHLSVPTDLRTHLLTMPTTQRVRVAYAANTLRWGGNHQRARNVAAFLAAWNETTA